MLKKKIHFLPLIIVLLAASSIIGPMPGAGMFYPLTMFGLLLFYILTGGKIQFSKPILCLIGIAILSTLINQPPTYFESWQRLGLFIIITGVVSSLIQNPKLILLRIRLFEWVLKASIAITVLSFIAYPLGINYVYVEDNIEAAHFGGITTHSMVLAPISAISLCYSIWLIANKQKHKKKYRYFYIGAIIISFLVLLLAASRAALLAGVGGLLFLLYKLNKQYFGKFVKYIFVIAMLLVITVPLWRSYSTRLESKQEASKEEGSTTSSRDSKWDNRQAEFESSPLFGIGYAAVSEDSDDFNERTGQVETGSSWMAVLSMLGILGFIPFAWLFFSSFYFLYKDRNNVTSSALLGGILTFFMIHMLAEGYVFGGGSYLFFMLWLTIGVVNAYKKTNFSF